jgi:ABC transporter substrate binding protein (PQQ-dependent alcohol dehydrogenase system)
MAMGRSLSGRSLGDHARCFVSRVSLGAQPALANNGHRRVDFLKSPDFSIAAFKGQRLTLRDWNLQLLQPILLVDGRVVVSVSPQEGFLHQVSELDTLGMDRPETECKLY